MALQQTITDAFPFYGPAESDTIKSIAEALNNGWGNPLDLEVNGSDDEPDNWATVGDEDTDVITIYRKGRKPLHLVILEDNFMDGYHPIDDKG